MKFYTDHYFQIGSAHYTSGKPCQDYSLSGSNELISCAIISDGCSTGRHTDVGSRILTLSTLQAIRDHAKASGGALDTAVVSITSRQQQIIGTARLMLGLERVDMLATCAYIYLTQQGGFTHVQGDGVVALKFRDGQIRMHRYEWANNTPFYPSYGDGGIDTFIGAHGGDLDAIRVSLHTTFRNTEGKYVDEDPKGLSLRGGLEGMLLSISRDELEQIEFVVVFSDGVTQIEGVDWRDAVSTFLSFKNTTGDFAKRRMIRGIKDMQQSGRGPVDDISYAVVRIEHFKEEEERHA